MESVDRVVSDVADAMERVRRRQRRIIVGTWCGTAGIGVAIVGGITATQLLQGRFPSSGPQAGTCILGGCPTGAPVLGPGVALIPPFVATQTPPPSPPDTQPATAPALASTVISRPSPLPTPEPGPTAAPPPSAAPPPTASPSDPVTHLVSRLVQTLEQLGL
jgi:hypothetical protein